MSGNDDSFRMIVNGGTIIQGYTLYLTDLEDAEIDLWIASNNTVFIGKSIKITDSEDSSSWDDEDVDVETGILSFKNQYKNIVLSDIGYTTQKKFNRVYVRIKYYNPITNTVEYMNIPFNRYIDPSQAPDYTNDLSHYFYVVLESDATTITTTGQGLWGGNLIQDYIEQFSLESGGKPVGIGFSYGKKPDPLNWSPETYTTYFSKIKKLDNSYLYKIGYEYNGINNLSFPMMLGQIEQLRYMVNELEVTMMLLPETEITKWTDVDYDRGVEIYCNMYEYPVSTKYSWNGGYLYAETYNVSSLSLPIRNVDASLLNPTQDTVLSYPYFQKDIITSVSNGENDNLGLPEDSKIGMIRWTYIKEIREAIERIIQYWYGYDKLVTDDKTFMQWFLGSTHIPYYNFDNNDKLTKYFQIAGSGIERKTILFNRPSEFLPKTEIIWSGNTATDCYVDFQTFDSNWYQCGQKPSADIGDKLIGGKILISFIQRWGGYFDNGLGGYSVRKTGGRQCYKWFEISDVIGTKIYSDEFLDFINYNIINKTCYKAEMPTWTDEQKYTYMRENLFIKFVPVAITLNGYTEIEDDSMGWTDWNFKINDDNYWDKDSGKLNIFDDTGNIQSDLPVKWEQLSYYEDMIDYFGNIPTRITLDNCNNFPFRSIWVSELYKSIASLSKGLLPIIFDTQKGKLLDIFGNEIDLPTNMSIVESEHEVVLDGAGWNGLLEGTMKYRHLQITTDLGTRDFTGLPFYGGKVGSVIFGELVSRDAWLGYLVQQDNSVGGISGAYRMWSPSACIVNDTFPYCDFQGCFIPPEQFQGIPTGCLYSALETV